MQQGVVDVTRARTAAAFKTAMNLHPVLPMPLLDLLTTLIQRIDDLEGEAGYQSSAVEDRSKADTINTQGR